jgi:hypothetical protein
METSFRVSTQPNNSDGAYGVRDTPVSGRQLSSTVSSFPLGGGRISMYEVDGMAYKDKEKKKETDRRYYESHREEMRERLKRWCKANPEKKSEQGRRYQQKYPERIKEKNRQQYIKNLEKRRESNRCYQQAHREQSCAYMRKIKDPEAYRARIMLRTAVAAGKIIKPENCQDCLKPFPKAQIQGHHEDYSRPYDVTWLCSKCHGKLGRRNKLIGEEDHAKV